MHLRAARPWWSPTAMIIGLLTTSMAFVGLGFGDTDDGGGATAMRWMVAGLAILAGLAVRHRHPLTGSWSIVVGGIGLASADLIGIPFAVVLIAGGLKTGNLVLAGTDPKIATPGPSREPRWWVWLAVAASLGAVGFLVLLVWPAVTPDHCTQANPCWEDTAAWATWILSWLTGAAIGAVGLILAGRAALTRHRTRHG